MWISSLESFEVSGIVLKNTETKGYDLLIPLTTGVAALMPSNVSAL